jgi:signal transduction histidine kinase
LRIYLAVLASLLVTALLFALVMRIGCDGQSLTQKLDVLAEVAAALLPPSAAPPAVQQAALEHWQRRADVDLALFGADGTPIAAAGAQLPRPPPGAAASHWQHGRSPGVMLRLPDGRWLAGRPGGAHGYVSWNIFGALALVALAVAIVAFPLARRLTRRLEYLQQSVEALGDGDLAARVAVHGHDEVARLAASFNRAAARIEALVAAQKSLLANASHELRSPLARIRMAAELQGGGADPATRVELERNIAELDQLIDEILLASRLDAARDPQEHLETVDLTALVAEECARAEVGFEGELASVRGDARLLRRLVRNLIENARRYGGAQPVEVSLARAGARITLEVADRGPGVAAAERERIFEPFYRARGASERQGAVGLGLALVRQIAARHQARVECLERPGGGSIFRVSGLQQAL